MKVLVAVLVSSFIAAVLAGDCSYSTKCPKIKPMKDLDFNRYAGKWVEFAHAKGFDYQCAVFDYMYKDGTPPTYTLGMKANDASGKPITASDQVLIQDTCDNKQVSYMDFVGGYFPSNLILYVLDTDYENTGVEYGCTEENGKITEVLCVQSREGKPMLDTESLNEILKDNGINPDIVVNSRPDSCM